MKFTPLLFLTLLTCTASAQNPSKNVDSHVVKVTVFPEGAQVTRIGHSFVPSGKTELIFTGISPYADASSIQVEGAGAFTILSVSPQPNKLKEQKKKKRDRGYRKIQREF
jgi:hypothetical protein